MTIKIIVNNVQSKFSEAPSDSVVEAIRLELRYKNDSDNPFMRRKLTQKSFNISEYKYLYHKGQKSFPTGLLPMVEKILKDHKVSYQIEDNRPSYPIKSPINLKNYKLRDYQIEAENKALEAKNCMVRIATGGGKTAIMASICGKLEGYNRIIFVRRQMLLVQTIEVFERELGIKVGQLGAGVVDIQPLTIAMIPTVARAVDPKWTFVRENDDDEDDKTKLSAEQKEAIATYLKKCEVLIIDECHCVGSDTAQLVAKAATEARYRLGFCLPPNSLVETPSGPKKISELRINDEVITFSITDGHRHINTVGAMCARPAIEEESYRFTTNLNKLECTGNHPIYTSSGYKEASNLNKTDLILSQQELKDKTLITIDDEKFFQTYSDKQQKNVENYKLTHLYKKDGYSAYKIIQILKKSLNISAWYNNKETPRPLRALNTLRNANITMVDAAAMMGLYYGDGSIRLAKNKSTAALYFIGLQDEIAAIHNLFLKYFNTGTEHNTYYGPGSKGKQKEGVALARKLQFPDTIARLLLSLGAISGDKTRQIYNVPTWIMNGSNDVKISFLQGLFSTDGYVVRRVRDSKEKNFYIRIAFNKLEALSTFHEKFFSEIQFLLKELQINSTIHKEETAPKNTGEKMIKYTLDISSTNKFTFLDQIGFPFCPHNEIKAQQMGYASFLRLPTHIQAPYFQGMRWTQIKDIEKIKLEEVWDISMNGPNPNFIASGTLVHNSATPWRDDEKDILLDAVTGPRVVDIDASHLINLNFLVPPHIYFF